MIVCADVQCRDIMLKCRVTVVDIIRILEYNVFGEVETAVGYPFCIVRQCRYPAEIISGVLCFFEELKHMEYMSINQAAQEWGISIRRIQVLCAQNRICGACRIGNMWAIPKAAQKPDDARIKSGKYVKVKEM